MQAHFINIDNYANAFNEPSSIDVLASSMYNKTLVKREVQLREGGKLLSPLYIYIYTYIHIYLIIFIVYERKWEIDSLASFISLSYRYWEASGDNSFVNNSVWIDAVDSILTTIKKQQEPTFNETTGNYIILSIQQSLEIIILCFHKKENPYRQITSFFRQLIDQQRRNSSWAVDNP